MEVSTMFYADTAFLLGTVEILVWLFTSLTWLTFEGVIGLFTVSENVSFPILRVVKDLKPAWTSVHMSLKVIIHFCQYSYTCCNVREQIKNFNVSRYVHSTKSYTEHFLRNIPKTNKRHNIRNRHIGLSFLLLYQICKTKCWKR